MFAPCINSINSINSIKARFLIIPTDAHNYKIIGMLKTIKIPTIAPTCFGPRRNHHQGVISCLAKTTIMILLCSWLMTWSMLWRHTSLLWKRAIALQTGTACLFEKAHFYVYIISCNLFYVYHSYRD